MEMKERLKKVVVVGAAGKMGSGISLLITNLVASQKPGSCEYSVALIDIREEGLSNLLKYLRDQLRKDAEKNINFLRTCYRDRNDLTENGEIIDQFINDALSIVHTSTAIESAKGAKIVFEAAIEDLNLKNQLFSKLDTICDHDTIYFTNTSSIPISELEKAGKIKGRIMGFHFYNPPPVQKLVETIKTAHTLPETIEVASAIGKELRKILIPSNDVAGFIGNGHFIRDGLVALNETLALEKKFAAENTETSFVKSIYALNKISQDFMLRPMGIFQLIDYVGIDVFQFILKVMSQYNEVLGIGENDLKNQKLHSQIIDRFIEIGVKGGQHADGSQKDGFLKYVGSKPVGVYDINLKKYRLFSEGNWVANVEEELGSLPTSHSPWKILVNDKEKDIKIRNYFKNLFSMETLGARLAQKYLYYSRDIALFLKKSNVANDIEHVNGVLINGFYHLFGPANDYY